MDQAARTITESERLALYHQAEQLAVSEAAVLPLYHEQNVFLAKSRVSGPIAFDWVWSQPYSNIRITYRVYLPVTLRN